MARSAETVLITGSSGFKRRIDEDSPLAPKWPYPRSKATTEALVREWRAGIPVVVNDDVVGLAIAGLGLPRGRLGEHCGGWDRWIV